VVGAIVLAGGRSSRMGTAKASLEWHGSTLLRRVAGLVERSVDGPVVIVRSVGQPLPELPVSWEVVDDVHPGRGPLEGLAAGLRALGDRAELAYASSTDVPFLHTSFVGAVVGGIGPAHEICVPVVGRRWQPLAAVYRTSLLPVLEDLLAAGERRVSRLFDRCRVNSLDRAALLGNPGIAAGDPELESLVNLNDPAAYAAARARPAPEISVTWSDRLSTAGRRSEAVRAANLGGLADALGLDEGLRVAVNGLSATADRHFPLQAGDAVTCGSGATRRG
jgi:molybdopterin-guanine dinucleotide biosynthesis protein A